MALALAFIISWTPAVAQVAPPPRHRVVEGDTLTVLALQYGSTVPAVMAANGLSDPDLIAVGRTLVMPPASSPVLRIETVPGDSLSSIARTYGTTPDGLRALNEMTDGQRLWVGQDLLVPPARRQPSPALPEGPLWAVELSPARAAQGETLAVHVGSTQIISLSAELDGQVVTLRPGPGQRYWGLVALHPLMQPGPYFLTLRWQEGTQPGGQAGLALWPIEVREGGYPTYDIVLPPSKGGLLDPQLTRSEAERLAAIWSAPETAPAWQGRFQRPIAEEYLTSAPFGQRRSYNGGPVSSYHSGQDFAAPEGIPVEVPARGQVVLAEELTVRGNAVIIDHGAGLYTGYWHLSGIEVVPGQAVEPGQHLGLVGTTGLSTGAHLHWEMRLHGIAVNPLQWVTQALP